MLKKISPSLRNCALAMASAVMLILAFPDSGWWWLAWFAFVPFLIAAADETRPFSAFVVGQLFGTTYFFGTCWWLAYAPIHYGGFPPLFAYALIFTACVIVGFFPAVFAAVFNVVSRRFGSLGLLTAPFIWAFSEYLRFWLTGNNWNAAGYSQAFGPQAILNVASVGGVYLVGFNLVAFSTLVVAMIMVAAKPADAFEKRVPLLALGTYFVAPAGIVFLLVDPVLKSAFSDRKKRRILIAFAGVPAVAAALMFFFATGARTEAKQSASGELAATAVVIQADVPMSYVPTAKLEQLRSRQIQLANEGLAKIPTGTRLVIFPESPMNYMYTDDREFHDLINDFARKNNTWVLFNSAEPDSLSTRYFNSAVMIDPTGKKAGQYDKIHLVPFGEAMPFPLDGVLPGLVGTFAYGREYDTLPVGDAKAGILICFESAFGTLSRRFVGDGADVLIELTNDGYLGPTPVLRQHLGMAIFRAVETARPVLRATNVGVTGYVNEHGQVSDTLPVYEEGTRIWPVRKSSGEKTFYVRFGDWIAWLGTLVTLVSLGFVFFSKRAGSAP
ncbi:MAG: apolipoprotein N-acyltransferase [Acidobacteria bacterium]|nr:apolipoprotein N-acyltransferase [Acidobacteriota bacterium]